MSSMPPVLYRARLNLQSFSRFLAVLFCTFLFFSLLFLNFLLLSHSAYIGNHPFGWCLSLVVDFALVPMAKALV